MLKKPNNSLKKGGRTFGIRFLYNSGFHEENTSNDNNINSFHD